jgi:CheY-like chemotaxis protein
MKLLIAEDEQDTALVYKMALQDRGHQVTITNNGQDCLDVYHLELQHVTLTTDPSKHVQPFDAVILDYKMPEINGMEVAKETLIDAIQQLNQIVELLQKPFSRDMLIDAIEDKEIYSQLQKFNVKIDLVKAANLRHEQLRDILEVLKKSEEKNY